MFTKVALTFFLSIFPAVILTHSIPASAQNISYMPEEWVMKNISSYRNYGRRRVGRSYVTSINSIVQKYLETFDKSDFGFDGISQHDLEIKYGEIARQQLSQQLSRWVNKDIDHNLTVTKKELEIFHLGAAAKLIQYSRIVIAKSKEQIVIVLNELVMRDLVMDTNEDNKISLKEAVNHFQKMQNKNKPGWRNFSNLIPMDFDENNDGIIQRQEYETKVKQVLADMDQDHDEILSEEEFQDLKYQIQAVREKEQIIRRQFHMKWKNNKRFKSLK